MKKNTLSVTASLMLLSLCAAQWSAAKPPFHQVHNPAANTAPAPEAQDAQDAPEQETPMLAAAKKETPEEKAKREADQKTFVDSLVKLSDDSKTLYTDQGALILRVKKVEDFMQTSANRLGLISILDADLKKMEAAIKAAYSAAEAAEVIPQAREKAKKLKAALEVPKADITAARKRVDAVVAKSEPIRKKLDSAAKKMDKVRLALTGVNEGPVRTMPFFLTIPPVCVSRIPESKQDCAYLKVSDVAAKTDAVVLEYDRVVQLLNTNPEPWLPSMAFFNPFSTELQAVETLREDMEKVLNQLRVLTATLNSLNAVMNEKFSFKFPYPNPKWDNPARISHYEVSISFKTIIKGTSAIEKEIEHILSSFLWKILKSLGVGKYVSDLQHQAQKAMDNAMARVDFGAKIKLPSMNALDPLEKTLKQLADDVDGLKLPEVNTKLPSFGLPNVAPNVNFGDIAAALKSLSPNGFNPFQSNHCLGVDYGCK